MRQLHPSLMLFLLLCAVLTLNVQASNLVVFDELHEDFTLVINGYRINNTPSQHVRVTGLQPSQYTVVAIFINPSLPRQTIYLNLQADREISYALVRGATKSGPLEFAFLSEYSLGYFPIAPQAVTTVPYAGPLVDPEPMPVDPAPVPVQPVPVQPGPVVVQPVPVQPVAPNPLPGYSGPIGCPYPMDPMQFGDARRSVESKTFSDTKMQIAKQITRNNCLLTSQVAEFMSLFSFESQKLEFAKFAYDYTYDKGNYYRVNDQFGFESSIRDLEQFLRGR